MPKEVFRTRRLNSAYVIKPMETGLARPTAFSPNLYYMFHNADHVQGMGFEVFAAKLYSEAAEEASRLFHETPITEMTARTRRGRADFGILAVWGHVKAGNIDAAVDFMQGFLADPHVPEASREKAMQIVRPNPEI